MCVCRTHTNGEPKRIAVNSCHNKLCSRDFCDPAQPNMKPFSLHKASWMQVLVLLACLWSMPNAGAMLSSTNKSRYRHQQHRLSASASGNVDLNIADIEKYAEFAGLLLKKEENALSLRLEAFPIENPTVSIGYLTCFIRPFPFGLLQLGTPPSLKYYTSKFTTT